VVDERVLIRLSREGDHAAFGQLVALKREKAFRIALNIVGSEIDADDVAQMAFIRLWSSLERFDENSRFDPWFCRIVVNLSIDWYRTRKRAPLDPLEAVEASGGGAVTGALPDAILPGADAGLMRDELRRIFNRLAMELAPVQRVVFTLREIEGMPSEEIAKVLEIRPSTVRNHIMAARRILQDQLRKLYPEYARGMRP